MQLQDSIDSSCPPSSRARVKLWSALFILSLALVLVAVWKWNAMPDDRSFLPTFTNEDGSKNGLAVFSNYLNRDLHISGGTFRWDFEHPERVPDPSAYPYLSNAETFRRFEDLMATDPALWRWPLPGVDFECQTGQADYSVLFAACARDEILSQTKIGRTDLATDHCLRLLRFGHSMSKAEGPLFAWSIAIKIGNMAERNLGNALAGAPDDKEYLSRIAAAHAPLEFSAKDYLFASQAEYAVFKSQVLSGTSEVWCFSLDPVEKRLFNKSRTLASKMADLLPALVASRDGWPACMTLLGKEATVPEISRTDWQRYLDPNYAGRLLVDLRTQSYGKVGLETVRLVALHRMNQIQLALRRYELDHQALPDKLSKLVPSYLREIPKDPFDGEPLRWNFQTRRIYSVSENRIDESGSFLKPADATAPDFGQVYWWN
jgi:hypothetical protein